jgi:hypothetical protein
MNYLQENTLEALLIPGRFWNEKLRSVPELAGLANIPI